ncbi:MAG: ACT domain-containing protein, partial [Pseudomonadota bacterium]|nr:ACT domain-containing protein [Pseudomonadota bacterium]
IKLSETRREDEGDYHTLLRLKIETEKGLLTLAGTLFSGKARIVGIDDVTLEAELTPRMLFVRNEDKPGFIGRLGTKLGEAKINVANFHLGRNRPGANAVCLVSVDGDIPASVLAEIKGLPGVVGVYALKFEN